LSQRKNNLQRIGAVSGIAVPILAFSCSLTAIASYPEFSWTNNALSDLGIIVGVTGPVFNFGLCSSGLLVFVFVVFGLFNYLGNSWIGRIGTITFVATGVTLMGIGIFSENAVPYHYLLSVAFFVLLSISLFIIAAAFALKRQTKMAAFTLLTGLFATTPWILQFMIHYVSGVAIPEFVSALAGSAWIMVLSYKMLRAASQPKLE
jgi:hypothetical membrane protein